MSRSFHKYSPFSKTTSPHSIPYLQRHMDLGSPVFTISPGICTDSSQANQISSPESLELEPWEQSGSCLHDTGTITCKLGYYGVVIFNQVDSRTEKSGLYIAKKEADVLYQQAEGEGAGASLKSVLASYLFPSSSLSLRPSSSLVLGSANPYIPIINPSFG